MLPALEETLDRAWPTLLRVATPIMHPRLKRLARTLSFNASGHAQKAFGALHGATYQAKITKKMIKEMMPHWLGPEPCFEGLILREESGDMVELLRALLEANGAPLRHMRWDMCPHGVTPTHEAGVMALLIDAHGQTLESFGVKGSGSVTCEQLDRYYQPLLARRAELPELRHLSFGSSPYSYDEDPLVKLLARPEFDDLETLEFGWGITQRQADALMQREASRALRRIGAAHVHASSNLTDLRALVLSPNLANVERWDLRAASNWGLPAGERPYGEWESPEADAWHAIRHNMSTAGHLLDREVADLKNLDAQGTREALCVGDTLRSSERLKALRLRDPDDALIAQIAAQGAEAWPALECLLIQRNIIEPELLDAWSASPLLDQLFYLDWPNYVYNPAESDFGRNHQNKERAAARRIALMEGVLAGDPHPFLGFRLWKRILLTITRRPELHAIGALLGLKTSKEKNNYLISKMCETQLIEQLGGRKRLLICGKPSLLSEPQLLWESHASQS